MARREPRVFTSRQDPSNYTTLVEGDKWMHGITYGEIFIWNGYAWKNYSDATPVRGYTLSPFNRRNRFSEETEILTASEVMVDDPNEARALVLGGELSGNIIEAKPNEALSGRMTNYLHLTHETEEYKLAPSEEEFGPRWVYTYVGVLEPVSPPELLDFVTPQAPF